MEQKDLNKSAMKYYSLFIKDAESPPARFGKSVYIQRKHHERISQIVHVIGNSEITLYDYIDNVLTQHFKNYNEEITHSFHIRKMY